MTEPHESRDQNTVVTERRDRPNTAAVWASWVGIVAGVVFVVAVVFFSGFFLGTNSSSSCPGGNRQHGMMERGQMGPGGMMGPERGMMGPHHPWPGPQPTTTAPPTRRP